MAVSLVFRCGRRNLHGGAYLSGSLGAGIADNSGAVREQEKADPDKHLKNAKQRNEPVRVEPEDGVRYEFARGFGR